MLICSVYQNFVVTTSHCDELEPKYEEEMCEILPGVSLP